MVAFRALLVTVAAGGSSSNRMAENSMPELFGLKPFMREARKFHTRRLPRSACLSHQGIPSTRRFRVNHLPQRAQRRLIHHQRTQALEEKSMLPTCYQSRVSARGTHCLQRRNGTVRPTPSPVCRKLMAAYGPYKEPTSGHGTGSKEQRRHWRQQSARCRTKPGQWNWHGRLCCASELSSQLGGVSDPAPGV